MNCREDEKNNWIIELLRNNKDVIRQKLILKWYQYKRVSKINVIEFDDTEKK